MKTIGFAGTLDPLTNGHVWVIEEARNMAENVEIYLSQNPDKKTSVPVHERKKLIEQFIDEKGWTNVKVKIVMGKFTARYAKNRGVDYLIRGIRNSVDFDYEKLIQDVNAYQLEGCKTLFVMPPADLSAVSSSFVKGLVGNVGWQWEVKKLIPDVMYQHMLQTWLRNEWEQAFPWSGTMNSDKYNAGFDALMTAYSGPDRHYHNLEHIAHGLSELNAWSYHVSTTPHRLKKLKRAWWYHDFIYNANNPDKTDEELSAEAFLDAYGVSKWDYCDEDSQALIMATDHIHSPEIRNDLKDVMIGADLAILGQTSSVYQWYSESVRKEYAQFSDEEYRMGRLHVLKSLLDKAVKGELVKDPYFAEEYGFAIVRNLQAEIAQLEYEAPAQHIA